MYPADLNMAAAGPDTWNMYADGKSCLVVLCVCMSVCLPGLADLNHHDLRQVNVAQNSGSNPDI